MDGRLPKWSWNFIFSHIRIICCTKLLHLLWTLGQPVTWLCFTSCTLSANHMQMKTYKSPSLFLFCFCLLKLPQKEAQWQNARGWEKHVEVYWFLGWLKIRDLFFHNSGSQKSEMSITGLKSSCWQGSHILQRLKRESVQISSSFWWLPTFLGLWPHHSNVCLHGQIVNSSLCLCMISFCFSLIRTLAIAPKWFRIISLFSQNL